MNKKIVFFLFLTGLIILNLQFIYNYYLNFKVNQIYNTGNYYVSYGYYSQKNDNDIYKFNEANSLYGLNIYGDSLKKYLSIDEENFPKKYELFFNIGDNYYRVGENKTSNEDKLQNYENALTYYEKAKNIDPTFKVVSNYEFVNSKINELKQKIDEEKKNQEEDETQESSQKTQSYNSKKNKQQQTQDNTEKNDEENSTQEEKTEEQEQSQDSNESQEATDDEDLNEDTQNQQENQDIGGTPTIAENSGYGDNSSGLGLTLTPEMLENLENQQQKLLEEQQRYQNQILKQQNEVSDFTDSLFDRLFNQSISDGDEENEW